MATTAITTAGKTQQLFQRVGRTMPTKLNYIKKQTQ